MKSNIYKTICKLNPDDSLKVFDSSLEGLQQEQVEEAQEKYGKNIVEYHRQDTLLKKIIKAFINPFTVVLLLLALVSFFTDYVFAAPGEKDLVAVIIIVVMVLISGTLTYIQTFKSNNAAEKLRSMVKLTANIKRHTQQYQEISMEEIVCGDIVHLSAGDMLPADVRILQAKDLFISQASLTGESNPIEKFGHKYELSDTQTIFDCENIAFMGTNVVSGSAIAMVIAIGSNTEFGKIALDVSKESADSSFEKGISSVSWLLIRFMMIMVPLVLFINGFTKGSWGEAFLFALSIAVGLTPEMLPTIVTTNLVKGTVSMANEGTIIKNLNSVQNFGAIDVLCTDKTGTLTQDKIVLEYHLDVLGKEDSRVLRHAYLNSHFQTGLSNLMDVAIIEAAHEELTVDLKDYEIVDEIPFDFARRRMSVVIKDVTGKRQMITKGAIEELLNISSHVEYNNEVRVLDAEQREKIMETVIDLNSDGFRVIGVAQKTNPANVGEFSVKDEAEMVLIGYLAFLDPPKDSSKQAIRVLEENGVRVKVLTGDNELVTKTVCDQVGLKADKVVFGSEIDEMSEEMFANVVEECDVFVKLSPKQKTEIVNRLKDNDHVVGFMGDGINDALAMKAADVGISVDTAVDIAKESADIILLQKDLMILEKGIIEGRRIFGNIIKYIKMTVSSNFGNVFSVLIASIFLPFLPMLPIQVLLLNLIYDISCISMPWDNVDDEYLTKPRKWDASSISTFMKWFGPTSSVFDILTYLIMYFIIAPQVLGGSYHSLGAEQQVIFMAIFNTGWFVQSLWSQTLVIHLLRTPKIPFLQSRSSLIVGLFTTLGIVVGTVIPYFGVSESLGMVPLPINYYYFLIAIVIAYFILIAVVKKIYMKKFGELL